jgi:hypothetical protein
MQSPQVLSLVAKARQQDLLREAQNRRLASLAQETRRQDQQTPKISLTAFVQRIFTQNARPQRVTSNSTC